MDLPSHVCQNTDWHHLLSVCVYAQSLSHVWLFATPWTEAYQAPLSKAFPRQYCNGLQFPPPGDLPNPGIEPKSPVSPALVGRFFTTEPPGKYDWYKFICFSWHPRDLSEVKWSELKSLSRVQLFATPWTVAYQDPQSMGFSRQEYWSGLPFPSPGDLPDPGIERRSPAL